MEKLIVQMAPMRRIAVSFEGGKFQLEAIFILIVIWIVSIAPLAADLINPELALPYLPRFHSEGYAVFSEKGVVGKLCAEGLEGESKIIVRQTVSESLCKSLGYE